MISVVMPAYNASKFLAPAIESILNQTFREFELIIVDDGSTDDTLEISQRYGEKDDRVKIIRIEHAGIFAARNAGISESQYGWIAVMDADDVALPERFERQVKAIQSNPEVVVWGSYAHHISPTGKVLSLIQQGPTTLEEFHALRRDGHVPFVVHPTALINKETLLKIGGYNPSFATSGDIELFDRMAAHGPILAIPEPLLLYRVHADSASMKKFFSQKLLGRYVVARHQARIAGMEELNLEQFKQDYNRKPILSRLVRDVYTLGQFYYRKAGLLFAEEHYLPASFYLCLAIAANPSYSIPRIWKQKFSPKARLAAKS